MYRRGTSRSPDQGREDSKKRGRRPVAAAQSKIRAFANGMAGRAAPGGTRGRKIRGPDSDIATCADPHEDQHPRAGRADRGAPPAGREAPGRPAPAAVRDHRAGRLRQDHAGGRRAARPRRGIPGRLALPRPRGQASRRFRIPPGRHAAVGGAGNRPGADLPHRPAPAARRERAGFRADQRNRRFAPAHRPGPRRLPRRRFGRNHVRLQHGRAHACRFSKTVAMPCPPPMHMAITP